MNTSSPIVRELEKLESIQAALAAIATRNDDQRRIDLIDLRRQLSHQIVVLGSLADPVFAQGDAEMAREYRFKFSRMRSAAAMHQANWPAVRLGEDMTDYAESARTVREANYDFIAWVRGALLRLLPEG